MRYLFALLVCAMLTTCASAPAFAECTPVEAASFIANGIESIAKGETVGQVILGDEAATFAKGNDITQKMLAAFMIQGETWLLLMILHTDETDMVCFGEPTDSAREAFKKAYGQGS